MATPVSIMTIFTVYLLLVWLGPRMMKHYKPVQLHNVLIAYNLFMVLLSAYMFYEVRRLYAWGFFSGEGRGVCYENSICSMK
jgi:hypothetical protein